MGPTKETAEEQLLRMIEGPAGPRPPRGSGPKVRAAAVAAQLKSRISGLWRWAIPGEASRARSDGFLWRLQIGERIIWVLLGGLALYLVVDLVMLKRRLPVLSGSSTPSAVQPVDAAGIPAEDQLKPLAQYREALSTRNPFGLSPVGGGSGSGKVKSRLTELTGALSVVGINRGRVPEALIEDSQDQRTHFVKVGDDINGLKVVTIDDRGVTVSYEGEETTLR